MDFLPVPAILKEPVLLSSLNTVSESAISPECCLHSRAFHIGLPRKSRTQILSNLLTSVKNGSLAVAWSAFSCLVGRGPPGRQGSAWSAGVALVEGDLPGRRGSPWSTGIALVGRGPPGRQGSPWSRGIALVDGDRPGRRGSPWSGGLIEERSFTPVPMPVRSSLRCGRPSSVT